MTRMPKMRITKTIRTARLPTLLWSNSPTIRGIMVSKQILRGTKRFSLPTLKVPR